MRTALLVKLARLLPTLFVMVQKLPELLVKLAKRLPALFVMVRYLHKKQKLQAFSHSSGVKPLNSCTGGDKCLINTLDWLC